jgi:hypothetical protein
MKHLKENVGKAQIDQGRGGTGSADDKLKLENSKLQKQVAKLKNDLERTKEPASKLITPKALVMIDDGKDCIESNKNAGMDLKKKEDAQQCGEGCYKLGYTRFVYALRSGNMCNCVTSNCKMTPAKDKAVYDLREPVGYRVVKSKSTCIPTSESEGKRPTEQECADICKSKGKNEFTYNSKTKDCKCASPGCQLKADDDCTTFEIKRDLTGEPQWHFAPETDVQCDYGTSATQDECFQAASELYGWEKKKNMTGKRLQLIQGGKCKDGGIGDIPLGCSLKKDTWQPIFKEPMKADEESCNTGSQLVCSGVFNVDAKMKSKGKSKPDTKEEQKNR